MMMHPEYQEKVHEEIKRKYGLDKDPDVNDMSELPFTEATLLEIQRHSCIFPFALPHSTTTDTEINGHFIPAKTLVFTNLWSIGHDPEVFSEPEVFNPYRFLTETGELDRSKSALFLPFGAGKRKCPGEQLGKMELFLFFAVLMQKCKFKKVHGDSPSLKSKYGLTLKPYDFDVIVENRHLSHIDKLPELEQINAHTTSKCV